MDSIEGRALSNPSYIPTDKTMVATFNLGDVASTAISWDVGDFSGLHVPDPKENYQRGVNNYGSSALQMYHYSIGVMINTFQVSTYPNYYISNGQVFYHWSDSENVHLWSDNSSIVTMHFNMVVPDAYVQGDAIAYTNAALLLKDTASGKELWYVVNIFDTRGEGAFVEYVTQDSPQDTSLPMIITYFGSGTRYAYRWINSSYSTGGTFSDWRFYEFCINTDNFTAAINDENTNYSAGLSTNPSDYVIVSLIIEAEIFWPEHTPGAANDGSGSQGHIAFAAKNIFLTGVSHRAEPVPELSFP